MKDLMESQKPNVFFTKKKIIFITLGFAIFVVFVFLMSKYFFDIRFDQIFSSIAKSFNENPNFFLWLTLLFGFPIFNSFWRIWPYYLKLREQNIYVEWYNWFIFCFITFLISSITPFAIGSEPYIIYWMSKRGLQTKEAAAIVASVMVLNPWIQVLITWPSFFILASSYQDFQNDPKWLASFWLAFFGLTVDLMGSIFWLTISISKRFHFLINLVINKGRQLLKLSYKNKDEIAEEFVTKAAFKKKFLSHIKRPGYLSMLIIGSLIWNFYYYGLLIISFNFVNPNHNLNPADLFNYINVATTANNFTPIPGAEGSLQAILLIFINAEAVFQGNGANFDQAQLKNLLDSSVVIWRTFSFYLPAILGAFCFFLMIFKESYKARRKHRRAKNGIANKSFTILIPVNQDYQGLKYTLKSVVNNHYYQDQLEVILISQDPFLEQSIQDLIQEYLNKYKYFKFYEQDLRSNWSQMIKKAMENKWINHDYLQILNPGSWLNLEILDRINNLENDVDLYVSRYQRFKKAHKVSHIINPYVKPIRGHLKINKVKSLKLKPFNLFVKTTLLNHFQTIDGPYQYQIQHYLDFVIQTSQSAFFLKSLAGTFCDLKQQ